MATIVAESALKSPRIALRDYQPGDEQCVIALLSPTLGRLYPGGRAWLVRRLQDVLSTRARCTLAFCGGELAGVLISTPKSRDRVKISTLYVSEHRRGSGVGGTLLDDMLERLTGNVREVYITAAHTVATQIEPLLSTRGFKHKGTAMHRYGPGRHEEVFTLNPPSR